MFEVLDDDVKDAVEHLGRFCVIGDRRRIGDESSEDLQDCVSVATGFPEVGREPSYPRNEGGEEKSVDEIFKAAFEGLVGEIFG